MIFLLFFTINKNNKSKIYGLTFMKFQIKKWIPILLVCAAVVLLYYFIGCPFRFIFGVPCPGCGVTRAWFSFLSGDLIKAFDYHPLFLLMSVVILLLIVKNGKLFKNAFLNNIFIYGFSFSVAAVYVVRMFLFFPNVYPFTYNTNSVLNNIIKFLEEIL